MLNKSEKPGTEYIPYTTPLDAHTNATKDWDVTRTIKLSGVPFETQSGKALNALTEQLEATLTNLGTRGTRVALWTHLVRRKLNYDLDGIQFDNHFSGLLNKAYSEKLGSQDFFSNELYVSPVYRTATLWAEKKAQKFVKDRVAIQATHQKALAEIAAITDQLKVSLRRYHPQVLGTDEVDGRLDSHVAGFYATVLNGVSAPTPVAVDMYPLEYAIQRSEPSFSGDIVTIESPDRTRYAAILGLKAPYSVKTIRSNILHGLLQLNCEFILSQSLTFMGSGKALKHLEKQKGQVESTSNNPLQIKELNDAIASLQNGDFGMGEHEFTLAVYGNTISELNAAVAEATSFFESKRLEIFRESRGGLITQYYGMLPGNFLPGRMRAQPISIANFVRFFPMHNYVTGSASGSQWGMPITMMPTNGQSPYFFNYHVSRTALKNQGIQLEYDPEDDDAEEDEFHIDSDDYKDDEIEALRSVGDEALPQRRQRKDSANYIAIGPNGSGKTVAQCFLRAYTRKQSIKGGRYKSFTFDKDCGQEIFINSLGGRYFRFSNGEASGIAPFSLPDTKRSRFWLVSMAQWCAKQDESYIATATDEAELMGAVAEVYKLSSGRRWARLADTLQSPPLKKALSRWINDGKYAWVLDNVEDRFDLSAANDFGFDMTEFLEDDSARTPILRYIKYKIDLSAPGRPYSIEIDEAATALKDELLRHEFIEKEARTIRKKEGLLALGVQDAGDLTNGPLAGVLTTQFPTLMIFPNGQADKRTLMDGLKLTEAEVKQVTRDMYEKPGSFLLKRGIESVVVQLDLSGMDDILSVLSGSTDNLPLVRNLIKVHGAHPDQWLPEFFKRRK